MLSDGHEGTLRLAHEVLYVGGVTLYSKSTEEYLKEIASQVRVGTVNEKLKPLSALATWLRADCAVTKITKKVAGRYLAEELLTKGLSANIVKHIMSDLSAYFGWLVIRGEIDVNPWHVMTAAVKQSSRGSAPKRRPWRDDEALKMLEALKPNSLLLPLTPIRLYAGMRIDELCSLKLVNVTEEMFTVTDSKTQAGVRVVPVHPVIRPLIARLIKTATVCSFSDIQTKS
jgi:integrase